MIQSDLERVTEHELVMKDTTTRTIVRWIHIVFSIPIIGYIYSPFEDIPNYAPPTRYVFFPVMLLSGFWMWKGHVLRRFISKSLGAKEGAALKSP